MAQHDQVIDNGPGLAFRTDINAGLAALFSSNAGPSQPTVTVAGQFWFDTSSATNWTLWLRNGANSGWVKLFDMSASAIIGMGLRELNGITAMNGGPLSGAYRNVIINGDFDIWQRNTTSTASSYATADRWGNIRSGSTWTVSRQVFTVGQIEVPGNPKYYMRAVLASVVGAGSYAQLRQLVEGVQTFSGKKVTCTFYMKADAAKNVAVELLQSFGTSGGSAAVYVAPQTCALTTAWKKFSLVFDVPSITGKVLGTANNDYFDFHVWLETGTNYDYRSNNLGQQSGTFDLAHVSVVEGDARQETDPFAPRAFGQEMALCQRYYEASYNVATVAATITAVGAQQFRTGLLASLTTHAVKTAINFRTRKRANPTMTMYSPGTGVSAMASSNVPTTADVAATVESTGEMSTVVILADTRAATEVNYSFHWAANAEL